MKAQSDKVQSKNKDQNGKAQTGLKLVSVWSFALYFYFVL